MMHSFLPELPDGHSWMLIGPAGANLTEDYLGESEATQAMIQGPDGGTLLTLVRSGDWGFWGESGPDGEGGLRQWQIVGTAPDGLYQWEQFEVLAGIPQRMRLVAI